MANENVRQEEVKLRSLTSMLAGPGSLFGQLSSHAYYSDPRRCGRRGGGGGGGGERGGGGGRRLEGGECGVSWKRSAQVKARGKGGMKNLIHINAEEAKKKPHLFFLFFFKDISELLVIRTIFLP